MCIARICDVRDTIAWINGIRLPDIPDLSQHKVLTWIDELIQEVATGACREWENP